MKKEAILYKCIKGTTLQCTCCSHYCVVKISETGKCGIRKNIDGKLYLLNYGQALGVNTDPIEKKPLFHFLPGTKIFSFGTAGCNFKCLFCQNYNMSQIRDSSNLNIEKIGIKLSPQDIIKYCKKYNIPSIAYTYNEPTIFFEYAYDVMKLAKKEGIKNVIVSNGFQSKEYWKKTSTLIDAINIDLKSFSDDFYREICGGKLEPVLDSIKYVHNNTDIWLEITTLIIPGKNNSSKELKKITNFIKSVSVDIPWHISAFYSAYKMLDTPSTNMESLVRAYDIGKEAGINYIYIGNLGDSKYETTYCPKCMNTLIEREGYIGDIVKQNWSKTGICNNCSKKIQGIWK